MLLLCKMCGLYGLIVVLFLVLYFELDCVYVFMWASGQQHFHIDEMKKEMKSMCVTQKKKTYRICVKIISSSEIKFFKAKKSHYTLLLLISHIVVGVAFVFIYNLCCSRFSHQQRMSEKNKYKMKMFHFSLMKSFMIAI